MAKKPEFKEDLDDDTLDDQNSGNTDNDDEDDLDEKKRTLQDEHKDLIEKLVEEKLKDIKGKLNSAYKKLEEEQKEKVRLKAETQDAKRKTLEADGKHLEAANLQLVELQETVKLQSEKLVNVYRDRELERALGTLDFRNDYAKQTAFNSILPELVQDEDDSWVHKSGASLADYVKTFAKDPNRDFLFKPKDNSGAGTSNNKGNGSGKRPTSLKGMTTEELLKHAAAGHFGN
jgi:vacuolar-type H+-ATPase subunit I/STV1